MPLRPAWWFRPGPSVRGAPAGAGITNRPRKASLCMKFWLLMEATMITYTFCLIRVNWASTKLSQTTSDILDLIQIRLINQKQSKIFPDKGKFQLVSDSVIYADWKQRLRDILKIWIKLWKLGTCNLSECLRVSASESGSWMQKQSQVWSRGKKQIVCTGSGSVATLSPFSFGEKIPKEIVEHIWCTTTRGIETEVHMAVDRVRVSDDWKVFPGGFCWIITTEWNISDLNEHYRRYQAMIRLEATEREIKKRFRRTGSKQWNMRPNIFIQQIVRTSPWHATFRKPWRLHLSDSHLCGIAHTLLAFVWIYLDVWRIDFEGNWEHLLYINARGEGLDLCTPCNVA